MYFLPTVESGRDLYIDFIIHNSDDDYITDRVRRFFKWTIQNGSTYVFYTLTLVASNEKYPLSAALRQKIVYDTVPRFHAAEVQTYKRDIYTESGASGLALSMFVLSGNEYEQIVMV